MGPGFPSPSGPSARCQNFERRSRTGNSHDNNRQAPSHPTQPLAPCLFHDGEKTTARRPARACSCLHQTCHDSTVSNHLFLHSLTCGFVFFQPFDHCTSQFSPSPPRFTFLHRQSPQTAPTSTPCTTHRCVSTWASHRVGSTSYFGAWHPSNSSRPSTRRFLPGPADPHSAWTFLDLGKKSRHQVQPLPQEDIQLTNVHLAS